MRDPAQVRDAFERRYQRRPRLFAAPGRVNLIGEHTDYNDGFVLPMALTRGTVTAAAPRTDRRLRVHSVDLDASAERDLDRPGPPRQGGWVDYVEGVAHALEALGMRLGGADLLVASDVPAGAGLSSSAALELSVGLALASLAGHAIDREARLRLAQAGQAAEHHWVGTRCGIMDQLIAALGEPEQALLIDCRERAATPVPLRLAGAAVVVCDSRVKHALASSAYNQRRAECEQAVAALGRVLADVRALRDVTPEALALHEQVLPEPVRRRARHVVQENARTLAAADALRSGDLTAFGRLMSASHRSLRDDYEVSCPELDLLVETALQVTGVLGSRMTGGGFGGCTVSLVDEGAVEPLGAALTAALEARFGTRPGLFVCTAGQGAHELLV